ncbi:MAG: hypothetical protein IPH89_02595 [Bacteroidetes bacterium]|nr:hypothetical protein [Bacteroidota bacterium]
MKKVILFTFVTIAFVGCKKEEQATTLIQTPTTEIEIAQIIEKADSELFHRIYEQKLPVEPIVRYVPGLFIWNGSSGGTMSCDQDIKTICMVEVIFPKMVISGGNGLPQEVTAINDVFAENEEAHVFLNEIVAPFSRKISSVRTTNTTDGNILINYAE